MRSLLQQSLVHNLWKNEVWWTGSDLECTYIECKDDALVMNWLVLSSTKSGLKVIFNISYSPSLKSGIHSLIWNWSVESTMQGWCPVKDREDLSRPWEQTLLKRHAQCTILRFDNFWVSWMWQISWHDWRGNEQTLEWTDSWYHIDEWWIRDCPRA